MVIFWGVADDTVGDVYFKEQLDATNNRATFVAHLLAYLGTSPQDELTPHYLELYTMTNEELSDWTNPRVNAYWCVWLRKKRYFGYINYDMWGHYFTPEYPDPMHLPLEPHRYEGA